MPEAAGTVTDDMGGRFYPCVVKGINSVVSPKGYRTIKHAPCRGHAM